MEELYERVLVHVPTQQLHESYNAVLQQEFSSVNAAVDDVVAAFAKLEEVRNAVAQLEQDHDSTGGRSASLMAQTANVMLLQRELEQKINCLATGMTVATLERKRKREEDVKHNSKMTNGVELSRDQSRNDVAKSKCLQLNPAIKRSVEGSKANAPITRNNNGVSSVANRDVVREVALDSNSVSSSVSESESEDDGKDGDHVEAALKALKTKGTEKSAPVPGKLEVPGKSSGNVALLRQNLMENPPPS